MTPDEVKALAQTAQVAKGYVDLFIKPSLEELGGILADNIGFFRLKNRVRLVLKAQQYLEAKGIKPTQLPPNVFVPLLEAAGDTDDETLSNMFAGLLTANLDAARKDYVHPSFAKVLGQLSPLDVRILKLIDDAAQESEDVDMPENHLAQNRPKMQLEQIVVEIKAENDDVNIGQIVVSTENLIRLGVVDDLGQQERLVFVFREVGITRLGARLLTACSDPDTYWRKRRGDPDEHLYQKIRDFIDRRTSCGETDKDIVSKQ